MKKPSTLLLCSLFFTLLISACSEPSEPIVSQPHEPQAVAPLVLSLTPAWETEGLLTPESVVYDANQDVLYVSNVNGSPMEADQNGFISKVSLTGKMISQQWVSGLNAPTGLAIHEGKLYVADIDTLVEVDIASATISQRYPTEGAKFLNDVTVSPQGDVLVSDMLTNTIHRLHHGQWEPWLMDAQLANPNGVHAEQDQLIVGAWGVMTDGFATEVPGHLLAVSYADKRIHPLGNGSPVGNLDGVEALTATSYLVTDWMAGKLYRVQADGSAELLLELHQGMADLEWIESKSLLLLPMMNDNKLLAYTLK